MGGLKPRRAEEPVQSGRRRRQWRRRLQPARRGVRQWDPAAVLAPRSCLAPRLQRPKGAARSPGGPRARTLPCHIIPGRLWSGEEDNIDVCGEQLVVTSQSWVPKQGNVRRLLCLDPSCQICEAATEEIQQLVQSEKSQLSPAFLGLNQGSAHSAHLETLPMSFEQNMELCSRHTRPHPRVPGNQTLTQLTGHLTQLTNTFGVQECWTDRLQLDQNFHLANMPMVSETVTSSRLKEPMVLMIEETIVQSKAKLDQESQDLHHVKSSVSLLSLDPNLTHTMSLHMDSMLFSHLPLLSPKVLQPPAARNMNGSTEKATRAVREESRRGERRNGAKTNSF